MPLRQHQTKRKTYGGSIMFVLEKYYTSMSVKDISVPCD